ncbi:uncharacterized protein LOC141898093 [Tubulanus polymorphus]|uniref:uncharacterized protein LOC141898093 n=1 Tax=Tubulanus polymorphus TaxID=672921 RepID=UPI003DA622AA
MKLLVVIVALLSADFYAAYASNVYGGYAARRDDAESSAMCPDGTVVKACRCEYSSRCDGAIVEGQQKCLIRMSNGQSPTRAIGECTEGLCGDDWKTVQTGYSKGQPSINCPDGYLITDCNVYSAWKHIPILRSVVSVVSQRIVGGKTVWNCKASKSCNSDGGCFVQARCYKRSCHVTYYHRGLKYYSGNGGAFLGAA